MNENFKYFIDGINICTKTIATPVKEIMKVAVMTMTLVWMVLSIILLFFIPVKSIAIPHWVILSGSIAALITTICFFIYQMVKTGKENERKQSKLR
jgi:glucan phosphoethanolaminetransferase (alkaline phosphatase superfamily)